ncbi:MAG: DUF3817 domain-containing protein [Acidimicrobiales bacterium]
MRVAALAETVSYLVLLVAVVVKYAADSPAGVSAVGPVHGVIFLAYAALVLRYRSELGWDTTRTAFALAAAVLPFGGLLVERRYLPAAAGR